VAALWMYRFPELRRFELADAHSSGDRL
jgi:hypothetical protein